MQFKTKNSVYALITFAIIIGTCVPYLIFLQELNHAGNSTFEIRQWIKICFPSFFFFLGIRTLFSIKRIEIEENKWIVTTLITGKKLIFTAIDVKDIKVFTTTSIKYSLKTQNLHISLYSRRKLKFSSRQMVDFDKLVSQSKKLKTKNNCRL